MLHFLAPTSVNTLSMGCACNPDDLSCDGLSLMVLVLIGTVLTLLFLVLLGEKVLKPSTHEQIKHALFEQILAELLHTD